MPQGQETCCDSIKIISTSSNINNSQSEVITNIYPHQRDVLVTDDVSSEEEGEIFDDLSDTNEGVSDSENLIIQDKSNLLWNTISDQVHEQDKNGEFTEEVSKADKIDSNEKDPEMAALFLKALSQTLSNNDVVNVVEAGKNCPKNNLSNTILMIFLR